MEIIRSLLLLVTVFVFVTGDNNFTFTYQMAQQCREYDCLHGYMYETFFRIDAEDHRHIKKDFNAVVEMHIAILAASNGHILLSSVPQPTASDAVYEIVVGGGANKFTELRRNLKRNAKASTKTYGILSAIEFRAFYIKVDGDGTIEFGRENDSLPLLSYFDMNPIPIKYFSFASWNGVEAKFLYDCPKPGDKTGFTLDSQAFEPKLSNVDQLKKTLLMDRDPYIPPSESMLVRIGITITNVKYDAFESTLKTGISLVLKWTDENMAWNPDKFNGTTNLKFREGQIWTPSFFVQNADSISPLESKRVEIITMSNSGEATYHFHAEINTFNFDDTKTYSKWPRDEYNCIIVIRPWEEHEDIIMELMYQNDTNFLMYKTVDQEIQNEWEIESRQVVISPDLVEKLEGIQGSQHQLLIDFKLRRNATAYNIVFYTPLLVIVTFVLMSFWSKPLQLSRIWFYIGATITICLGLCYINKLVPVHTVPTILILYTTILSGVLIALLLQVALMSELAARVCKTQFVNSIITTKIVTLLFCLPSLKICQNYDSFNEAFASHDEENEAISPRSASVEEMDRENEPIDERVLVAECLDKTLFVVYSIVMAVMLTLHY